MASNVAVNALERIEAHGIAVDARAIEAEFERIWQETENAGEDTPGVRVRTLNLVAVGAGAEDLQRFEDVMQELPVEHPCRGIFAIAAPPHSRLTASISARCWPAATGRHVCSEEIVLAGAPSQEREVASAVLGLLVPELPLAVWLMNNPGATRELAGRLMDAGDSLILDSGRAPDPRSAYTSIVALGAEHDVRCFDLAWARLGGWRALTAQMFDGDAGARELQQIRQIEIRGGVGAPSSEALLAAGWLASRLDYALADVSADDARVLASFYAGTRGVRLSVEPAVSALDAIMIRTTDAAFAIERDPVSAHLHVREVWDSGETQRVVQQPAQDDCSLIALMLDGLGDSAAYRDALMAAMALVGV